MSISPEIQYASLDELYMDPMNPRLGRSNTGRDVTQERVLELMQDWAIDELAVSFLESGFWPQEALIVTKEKLCGKERMVVIEGNRRVAALIFLRSAIQGNPASPKWADIARAKKAPANLFTKIPYILLDSRKEIDAFLGFRHVTGIMEWRPAEKAQYIAKLIEEGCLSYEQVMRKIGSKTTAVRQNYIAYRVLMQMEGEESISIKNVEEKFSVLYLSLRTAGVQRYLDIDIKADPQTAQYPVPKNRLKQLTRVALWLFGDEKSEPLFTDSRYVDKFGTILESPDAVAYLERSGAPKFEVAYRTAGGDEPELVKLIEVAADNIELVLGRAHLYKKSSKLRKAIDRLYLGSQQLRGLFPETLNRDHRDGQC